ncbi:MAG: LapA family protein [Pseudomonadota bacterium]|nr:LapA family protein [Pseudomonadota bacterium]
MNWEQAPLNFWPLEKTYMHVMAPVGLIAVFFFLLGALPTWLLAQAGRWRMKRRMAALENSVRAVTPTPPHAADLGDNPATGVYPGDLKEG